MRLDRAVANDKWRDLFPNSQIEHLACARSDHYPIVLKVCSAEQFQPRRKCLHYEIFWEREPAEVIQETWSAEGEKSDLADISRALGKLMSGLHSCSKKKCKNVGREIEKGRKKLSSLLESNADSAAIRLATDQLNELLYREEMLWLQRSRIDWLKEGDRNTKFFHSKAVWRAKKNKISKLRDSEGTVHSSTNVLEQMSTDYFKEIFSADPSLDHSKVTRLI